jgi:hypothetical protein
MSLSAVGASSIPDPAQTGTVINLLNFSAPDFRMTSGKNMEGRMIAPATAAQFEGTESCGFYAKMA